MNHVADRWGTQEEIYKQLKAGRNRLPVWKRGIHTQCSYRVSCDYQTAFPVLPGLGNSRSDHSVLFLRANSCLKPVSSLRHQCNMFSSQEMELHLVKTEARKKTMKQK